jgi:hypothetical protein
LQGALFGSELPEKFALAQLHEQESQGGEKNAKTGTQKREKRGHTIFMLCHLTKGI